MRRLRQICGGLAVLGLFVTGVLALVSYIIPIGLTLQHDNQGNYLGFRAGDGFFGVLYSSTVPSSSPRTGFRIHDWSFAVFAWELEPRSFVTCEVSNHTGDLFSTTYAGTLPPPYLQEHQQQIIGIHGSMLLLTALTGLLFVLRRPIVRWRWRRAGRCEGCGYDGRGNTSAICPECGAAAHDSAATGT